jgi:putative acyl-CoA dehydrogenase
MALDVLRVLKRAPGAFRRGYWPASNAISAPVVGGHVRRAARCHAGRSADEGSARILTEQLALSAAAAELKRLGAGRIADAFIETRLAGQWRSTYGMLDGRATTRALIVETLYPA